MTSQYRAFFGLKREPFASDLTPKDLLKLPGMVGVKERMDYALSLGGVMLVTGEVGSGKSTALRWSLADYHPSQILVVSLTGSSASLTEILKTISLGLGLQAQTTSRSRLVADMKNVIKEIVTTKKQQILFVLDEAQLIRNEVFAELHAFVQFEFDSRSLVTTVLCGQASLLDKLHYRAALPLASRVVAKSHLTPLSRLQLEEYVAHHLQVAGQKKRLFDEGALTAIYQGSGGLLRKTNALARGGLLAAATEGRDTVTAEHIRIAASELI